MTKTTSDLIEDLIDLLHRGVMPDDLYQKVYKIKRELLKRTGEGIDNNGPDTLNRNCGR
jgi:hypothetical protein